ncbi:DNA polymerase III subunit beta [soil metagenome]
MKIICDRGALLEAVNLMSAVVPARTPSPALSCVKLVATKSHNLASLQISGTDGETALELNLSAVDVTTPGTAVVSADKVRQIIQSINDPTVTLELDGDTCHIKGSHAKFRVFAFNTADYPPLPPFNPSTGVANARAQFTHSAGALLRLINRTMFATAKETSRYAINGVLLKRDGKKLEMVATDGRRLALARGAVKSAPNSPETGPVSCIIPTKALNLFTRLSGDPDAPVRIALTDNRIFFAFDAQISPSAPAEPAAKKSKSKDSGGGTAVATVEAPPAVSVQAPRAVLSSTLVEGAFPPYEDVIPKDQDKKATAAREDLIAAVRQASVLTNEESRGIRMTFTGKTKSVKLASRAPEMGESEIDLALTNYEGEDLEICFNPHFISDVLKTLDEPEIVIEFKAPNKPGVVRAGTDFTYVIMPVNLPS